MVVKFLGLKYHSTYQRIFMQQLDCKVHVCAFAHTRDFLRSQRYSKLDNIIASSFYLISLKIGRFIFMEDLGKHCSDLTAPGLFPGSFGQTIPSCIQHPIWNLCCSNLSSSCLFRCSVRDSFPYLLALPPLKPQKFRYHSLKTISHPPLFHP